LRTPYNYARQRFGIPTPSSATIDKSVFVTNELMFALGYASAQEATIRTGNHLRGIGRRSFLRKTAYLSLVGLYPSYYTCTSHKDTYLNSSDTYAAHILHNTGNHSTAIEMNEDGRFIGAFRASN